MQTPRLIPSLLAAAASVFIAVLPAPTLASAETTFEKTLANGLRVIVKEDHRAPTVVHMVWYRAGAMDEKDGTSGVAHVLEHMMFKGTKTLKPGEFNKRVAEAGGRDNAFTSLDYTAYFQIVPKGALPEMMRLEADRMANLQLQPEAFAAEIQVVMEERRLRTDDNPQSRVYESLNAAAFTAHPYRRPVIGWMDDLKNMNWQDARDWYRAWYAPNNAYVVVAGDVDHREVFRLAEQTYGKHKAQPLPTRKPQNEPQQTGLRRVTVKAPAQLPYILMAWKAPKLKNIDEDRDPYALEVLASLLAGNDAARFPKRLVRGEKLAQSASAGYDATLRGESLFILAGQPANGKSIAELETALKAEIRRIQEDGVTAEELKRVKTQTIAAQVYKRDSLMAQAMEIGFAEATGVHWRNIDKLLEKIRSVTAAEVQAVAQRYFSDDTLTVSVLDPQPIDPAAQHKPAFAVRH
ncbi:MAG: insulinase family protein [Gammaproteobacteria bacterium]|nr:insulinase family protein [Rhodocyclaceae bacterium]MBU3909153.1 insulinase family protein [Gammaproteobacteria bacterium]MBU3988338.1 insulinase family protein [Gammaproteobacteria bacterium]MBU4005687.1 insulinase family protein [Gammaproteobacteria bacterium]MBU4020760.1 insulinase family protein [Gammaproteobacteria bacterium]